MTSERKVLLLVEGKDEEDFFRTLAKVRSFSDPFDVKSVNGRDNLINYVTDLVASSELRGRESVGIVLDSEDESEKSEAIAQAAISILGAARPKLTTRSALLPGVNQTGSLETLCLKAIETPNSLLNCANELTQCVTGSKDHAISTQARRDKLTFFAWHFAKTGKSIYRFGQGVEEMDFQHACFDEIADFLRELINQT